MPAPNDPPPGGADALAQSEVERLLAQVAAPENNGPLPKQGGEKETSARHSIRPYNFRHPVFLSPGELRRLRLRHEEFTRALAARLSIYLRLEFTLQMSGLQTIPYQKFVESLPHPTYLSLFKVEPLRGIGLLDIPPRLGLTMIDRQLGGPAQSVTADRDFSEIEVALLDQSVHLILGEWCSHWASVQELRPVVLGHENNGQFLQTAPRDTLLLVLAMEAKLGDCVEPMQLALPCFTLEPLIRKLGHRIDAPAKEQTRLPSRLQWNRSFDDVPVPVTAIWDDLVMTAREVASLRPGDILPLDPGSARRVTLRLADLAKFHGQLGTTGGKWAVAVTGTTQTT